MIAKAVEDCGDMLAGRRIEVRMSESLPRVFVDPVWIEKVLVHLLENAVKYSPEAEPIFISAERHGDTVVVSVADRGAGIDPMEQSMIFDKFYRGQSQRYRVQGTGMGLAISKAIVEAGTAVRSGSRASPAAVRCSRFRLPIANQL